jgi:hypothetical protein
LKKQVFWTHFSTFRATKTFGLLKEARSRYGAMQPPARKTLGNKEEKT